MASNDDDIDLDLDNFDDDLSFDDLDMESMSPSKERTPLEVKKKEYLPLIE